MQDAFELVYSYNVVPAEAGVTVVPPSPAQPGQHVVLRLKKPAPRFALLAGWERASDEDALRLLGSSTHALFERALVAPEFAGGLPPLDGRGMAAGAVKLNQYRSGRMELTTESGQANVLRVSEKYDGDWTATVDGKPAAVLRVDYIFQGLLVPAGRHEVVLQYAPPLWPLASQAAGLLICLGAIGSLIGSRFRRSASNGETTSTDTSPA